MASQSHEEQIIKTTIELLSFLTSPADQNDGKVMYDSVTNFSSIIYYYFFSTDGSNAHQFDDILFSRLSSANVSDTFERLNKLIPTAEISTWLINNERLIIHKIIIFEKIVHIELKFEIF